MSSAAPHAPCGKYTTFILKLNSLAFAISHFTTVIQSLFPLFLQLQSGFAAPIQPTTPPRDRGDDGASAQNSKYQLLEYNWKDIVETFSCTPSIHNYFHPQLLLAYSSTLQSIQLANHPRYAYICGFITGRRLTTTETTTSSTDVPILSTTYLLHVHQIPACLSVSHPLPPLTARGLVIRGLE